MSRTRHVTYQQMIGKHFGEAGAPAMPHRTKHKLGEQYFPNEEVVWQMREGERP